MDANELRSRAAAEIPELGQALADRRDHEMGQMERRGAVVLLAALADWNADLLQRPRERRC